MDKLKMVATVQEFSRSPERYYAEALGDGWRIETTLFSTRTEAHDALQKRCERAGIVLEWAEGAE
jgi:hypothetical protein